MSAHSFRQPATLACRLGEVEQEVGKKGRYGDCSEQVIGACIDVHRELGPGLLESAYEQCLAYELGKRQLVFQQQLHQS